MREDPPIPPVKIQSLDRSNHPYLPPTPTGFSSATDDAVLALPDDEDEAVAVAIADDEETPLLAPAYVDENLLNARPQEKKMVGTKLTAIALAIVVHAALLLLLGVLVIIVPAPPMAEITAMTATELTQEKPETKQIIVPQPSPTTPTLSRQTTSAMSAVGVSSIALPNFDFKAPAEPVTEIATTDMGNSFATAFQPKGTTNVNFFGIKSKGRRIAFLIEAERYMLTDPKGGIPAYQIVKEEIANMISKFGVSTAFNVLMFDHFHLSAFSERLVPGTTANMSKVRDWLYPVNQDFAKIGLASIGYPALKAKTEVEPIQSRLLQGYMLAIQYALESDVDTVFIITSGWRHMSAFENQEEIDAFLKKQRWGEKEEREWLAAVKQAQEWLIKENAARKAKGVPERVIRSIHEVVSELKINVRHKPGLNIEAEVRQDQIMNAMRIIYSGQGKAKPQINFVLFVGEDEETIPMEKHFEDIAQRARGGKTRVLRGLGALKNVTGR